MNARKNGPPPQLRDAAEAQLARAAPDKAPARSAEELLHELQVHQIELEMQNESLRQTQVALEESRDRYAALYEFAPVGYLTLTAASLIAEVNLTSTTLLGLERKKLHGRRFDSFVSPDDRERWNRLFIGVLQHEERAGFELALRRGNDGVFHAWVDCLRVAADAAPPVVRLTLTDISARKQLELELAASYRRLDELSRSMVEFQENARRQLSGELHDRTSPNLAALKINMGILAALSPEQATERTERLEDTRALLADTNASIREIASDLRHPLLDYAGLPAAVTGYAHQFAKRTGIAVNVDCVHAETRLAPATESLLFRIFQEALTNCAKHARAKSVAIRLNCVERPIALTIQDDGIGFDWGLPGKTGNAGGLGLLGMQEMAEFAGGHLVIESQPGQGTRIAVEV